MSDKVQRNEAAYEQITAILTATGRPMGLVEIHEHPLFRPMNATTRSLGQWLKYLMDKGVVTRKGKGSRRAVYTISVPKAAKASAKVVASDSVIIRVTKDGAFKSVQAPAGVEIALEVVA